MPLDEDGTGYTDDDTHLIPLHISRRESSWRFRKHLLVPCSVVLAVLLGLPGVILVTRRVSVGTSGDKVTLQETGKWNQDASGITCDWLWTDNCVNTDPYACSCRDANPLGPCTKCPGSAPNPQYRVALRLMGKFMCYTAGISPILKAEPEPDDSCYWFIQPKQASQRRLQAPNQTQELLSALNGIGSTIRHFKSLLFLNKTGGQRRLLDAGSGRRLSSPADIEMVNNPGIGTTWTHVDVEDGRESFGAFRSFDDEYLAGGNDDTVCSSPTANPDTTKANVLGQGELINEKNTRDDCYQQHGCNYNKACEPCGYSPYWGYLNEGGPTRGTTNMGYDCNAGYANWRSGWAPSKKVWCCSHENKACR